MSVFGLSHTYNTKVGSDFVRGVSGGERKRVSIAEMALTGSPLAAWDNSTRGLDVSIPYSSTRYQALANRLQVRYCIQVRQLAPYSFRSRWICACCSHLPSFAADL